jgi:hypothetical protein
MERKRGVKVPYNLTLSCMRKYFTNFNLSSSLFGQCTYAQMILQMIPPDDTPDDTRLSPGCRMKNQEKSGFWRYHLGYHLMYHLTV